jgi:CBS domain-containing protein
MKLQDILSVKGTAVHSISPDATLDEVVSKLIENRIGSLVICHRDAAGNDNLAGIITDRDILYASATGKRPLDEVKVSEVMTTALITGAPDDEVEQAMALMTAHRIRHLPVLVRDRLAGIISIGDVVKAQVDRLAMENRFMRDYITG